MEAELLTAAASSSYYMGILKTTEPWPLTSTALHHKIVQLGGTSKQGCFSIGNIICASHYASTYRGITSGRSGQRLDYRKPDCWVRARDTWRRKNLLSRADGDYSVINVASRLFPHDTHDFTLACAQIDIRMQICLMEIMVQLRDRGIRFFFRGFPARLQDNIRQIQAMCHAIGIQDINLISTGSNLVQEQREVLQCAIGNGQLITEYGAQDCGIQLYSCPECGAFHLENPRSLLSIYQKRLYSTDRFSIYQPVVAMYTGDQMVASEGSCRLTGQRGYHPNPMPGFSAAIRTDRPGAVNDTTRLQHEAARILPTWHSEPVFRQIIEAAGFGRQTTGYDATQQPEELMRLIVQHAERGEIHRCRQLLETSISQAVLQTFQNKQVSLINHLISYLMIWAPQPWGVLIQSWVCCTHTQTHDGTDITQRLREPLQQISSDLETSHDPLRRLHRQVVIALISIMQTNLRPSEVMRSNVLHGDLQPILHSFHSADPPTQQSMLPSISAIKDHILSHLWHTDSGSCSPLHPVLNGCDDTGIQAIETLHRSGLLRKF